LQRWINFTNDIKFVLDKQKILGFANLAPEVAVYYKMISKKAKVEAGIEDDLSESDQELMDKIKDNIDRLSAIMEGDEAVANDEATAIDKERNKLLH
jgi:glutaredoxin 2